MNVVILTKLAYYYLYKLQVYMLLPYLSVVFFS